MTHLFFSISRVLYCNRGQHFSSMVSWPLSPSAFQFTFIVSCFFRTLLASCIHALLMGSWIFLFDRSPFCAETILHSILFSLVLGFVFVFNYISPKTTNTRYRFTIYYSICFVENVTCVIVYNLYASETEKNADYFVPLCISSILPFVIGIAFMLLYYEKFHPNVVNRKHCDRMHHRESNRDENIQMNNIPTAWKLK